MNKTIKIIFTVLCTVLKENTNIQVSSYLIYIQILHIQVNHNDKNPLSEITGQSFCSYVTFVVTV